ncbi:MAG: YncE family protein [Dehalococcoidia bacterium]|nr:YncE family protein [Dehalococcoidia bacterium]
MLRIPGLLLIMLGLGVLLAGAGTLASAPAEATNHAFELWVADQGTDKLHVYDGTTLRQIAELTVDADGVPASSRPHMLVFSPEKEYLYVANVGSPANTNNVLVVRARDRRVVATLPAGPQAHAAIPSADGGRVIVANIAANDLTEINANVSREQWSVGRRLPAHGVRPICPAYNKQGDKIYITNGGTAATGGNLVIANATDGSIIKRYDDFGREACGVANSLDGQKVFTNVGFHANNPGHQNDRVMIWHSGTGNLLAEVKTQGVDAHGLQLTPDGRQAWVVNRQSGSILIIDAGSHAQLGMIQNIGDKIDLIEFSPDGTRAFVTMRGEAVTGDAHALTGTTPGVAVIDVASRRVVQRLNLPGDPHGLAVRPVADTAAGPAVPLALPRTGDPASLESALAGLLAGVLLLLTGARLAWRRSS